MDVGLVHWHAIQAEYLILKLRMSANELSIKILTAKIIQGVIVTLIVGIVVWGIKEWWFSSKPISEEVKTGVLQTLKSYSEDLNRNSFDAHRHFSHNVERFYQMLKTTPGKINETVNGLFYEQFRNPSMTFDESTLTVISSNDLEHYISIIMYSDYFKVEEKKQY
ncbi:MAG TPA: hypothetical protein VI461_05050, partial [Chitinophagaceae bacterium]|nr:hypothetical protein [Chitinophagaceae bacterium]